MEFIPGAVSASTSTVTVSPAIVTANGTTTATITVSLEDDYSNPITDALVTLAQTGSSIIGGVTNNGDGTYTFSVTSTTAETVTYTAIAEIDSVSTTITATAKVYFIAFNAALEAGTQTVTLNEDTTKTITLTATGDDTLTYSISTQPINGSLTGTTTNTVVYTPKSNYFGTDSFVFAVFDSKLTTTTTISIIVESVNDAPVAVASAKNTFVADENVFLYGQGSDIEDDANSLKLIYLWTGAFSKAAKNIIVHQFRDFNLNEPLISCYDFGQLFLDLKYKTLPSTKRILSDYHFYKFKENELKIFYRSYYFDGENS